MKKLFYKFIVLGALSIFLLPAVAFACGPTFGGPSWGGPSWLSDFSFNKPTLREAQGAQKTVDFKVLRKEEKQAKVKQIEKNEKKETPEGNKKDKSKKRSGGKKNMNFAGPGTILATSDTALTVKGKNDTEIILTLTPETKLRYPGAKAELADFEVGDSVRFVAHKNEAGTWEAKKILNHSLRRAMLQGEVKNFSGSSFDLETRDRGTFTITVSENTKFRFDNDDDDDDDDGDRNDGDHEDGDHDTGSSVTLADLKNGMKVSVKVRMHDASTNVVEVKAVIIKGQEEHQEEEEED